MLNWLKKIWRSYLKGAKANDYPISMYGFFGQILKFPSNLDEALDVLDKMLSTSDKYIIGTASIAEQDVLARTHHSLGRRLRNDWGLWAVKKSSLYRWFLSRGIWHADDMSSIIIMSYCRKLRHLPIRLEEQIQGAIEYWKALDDNRGVIQWNE